MSLRRDFIKIPLATAAVAPWPVGVAEAGPAAAREQNGSYGQLYTASRGTSSP